MMITLQLCYLFQTTVDAGMIECAVNHGSVAIVARSIEFHRVDTVL